MIKVLLADDETKQHNMLELALKKENKFNFLHAYNTEETCKMALDNRDIDYILLDLRMPLPQDGLRVLENLANSSSSKSVKIIIISAYLDDYDIESYKKQYPQIVQCFTKTKFTLNELKNTLTFSDPQGTALAKIPNSVPVLTLDLEKKIRQEATKLMGEIVQYERQFEVLTSQFIIASGQKISRLKELLPRGKFKPTLAQMGIDYTTAKKRVGVARTFHDVDLGLLCYFDPTALYNLYSPEAAPARIDAIALAEQGIKITNLVAIDLRRKYNPTYASSRSLKSVNSHRLIVEENRGSCWWNLQGDHKLFLGQPNSDEFLQNLPKNLTGFLSFPSSKDLWYVPIKLPTEIPQHCLFLPPQELTRLQDPDDLTYISLIQDAFYAMTTHKGDAVGIAYLPVPELVLRAEEENICCWIAEPDEERCESLLALWSSLNLRFEKILAASLV